MPRSQVNRLTRGPSSVAAVLMLAVCVSPATAPAQSVDPAAWVKADLLDITDGTYTYDHISECLMRDEAATPSERVLARIRATALESAISRDQLIALVQRMESVFLMSIGQGFRPTATAMTMASIIDCRPRPKPAGTATQELVLEVGQSGFVSKFIDHTTGTTTTHGETWVEAFRP